MGKIPLIFFLFFLNPSLTSVVVVERVSLAPLANVEIQAIFVFATFKCTKKFTNRVNEIFIFPM